MSGRAEGRGEGSGGALSPDARVAVIGLGASGEAASRLAAREGAKVYASDVSGGESQRSVAERLRREGVDAEAGGHDMDKILGCGLVVVSPGVPPSAEVRRRIREGEIRTVSEAEFAYWHLDARIVGITGTNGKTTTTALCGHLLQEEGLAAVTGGNIGRPLSEIALQDPQPEWVAVELSSFQLADIESFRTDVGVFLNLAPDHLDRYRDVDSYYGDKKRIFENATAESRWVLNADDPDVLDLARNVRGEVYHFSGSREVERGAFVDGRGGLRLRLNGRDERCIEVDDLQLIGRHNVENALAAGLAAALVGCGAGAIGRGLESFEPLPHRLEPLGEIGGVRWVNDSKATNVSATRVALRSFRTPIVLLLGGRHKGESYAELAAHFDDRVRAVVAFGEAAPQIVSELRDAGPPVHVENGLDSVVERAAEIAREGDVVLFSPACSSYDMFPDYEARGLAFAEAVRALPTGRGSR